MQTGQLLTWSTEQNDDKIVLRLSGELSRDTLLPLWNEWKKGGQRASFLSEADIMHRHIRWDLGAISRIDSAGVALLCNLLAYCRQKQQDKTLLLENVPPQLMTLADLFDLTDWLKPFIK